MTPVVQVRPSVYIKIKRWQRHSYWCRSKTQNQITWMSTFKSCCSPCLPDPNSPWGHSVRHTQFLSDMQTQFNFQKLIFQEKKSHWGPPLIPYSSCLRCQLPPEFICTESRRNRSSFLSVMYQFEQSTAWLNSQFHTVHWCWKMLYKFNSSQQ